MNLENLNLVELNAQEIQETEGGTWGIISAVVLASGPVGIVNIAPFALGFYNGYNSQH